MALERMSQACLYQWFLYEHEQEDKYSHNLVCQSRKVSNIIDGCSYKAHTGTKAFRDLLTDEYLNRQIVVKAAAFNLCRKIPWFLLLFLLTPQPSIEAVFVLMLNDWMISCMDAHKCILEIFAGDTKIVTTLQRLVSDKDFSFDVPTLFPELFNSPGSVLGGFVHKAKLIWLIAVDPSETDQGERLQIFKQSWFGKQMSASVIALNQLQQPSHWDFDESPMSWIRQPPDQDNMDTMVLMAIGVAPVFWKGPWTYRHGCDAWKLSLSPWNDTHSSMDHLSTNRSPREKKKCRMRYHDVTPPF